ncbi:MAG: hypothetical protein ACK4RZ_02255 [Paracoccaceae bacterium]
MRLGFGGATGGTLGHDIDVGKHRGDVDAPKRHGNHDDWAQHGQVVVDATGVPALGAEIGFRAMELGKHLVMMNVEADVTIGAYLRAEAERLG